MKGKAICMHRRKSIDIRYCPNCGKKLYRLYGDWYIIEERR